MATLIGQDTTGVGSTWGWLRSPLGNNQNGYSGGSHNLEFDAPGFMTAQNTFFRSDQGPFQGTLTYMFVTTDVDGQPASWFRFGARNSRILVEEDEAEILGKDVVLDNASQTIAVTADAYEGPFGFGQELDPDSADILEVHDFLPY
jgi:hypothetical protein